MIRLAIVNYYTVKCEDPKDVLKQHFTISDWVSALKKLPNIELFIFYRFHENHVLKEQNVTYTFLKDSLPPELKLHHFPFSYFRKLKRLFKKL